MDARKRRGVRRSAARKRQHRNSNREAQAYLINLLSPSLLQFWKAIGFGTWPNMKCRSSRNNPLTERRSEIGARTILIVRDTKLDVGDVSIFRLR
jgi:hypothetical protein